eukprot:7724058-Pyramimonas_sp.AAC.1
MRALTENLTNAAAQARDTRARLHPSVLKRKRGQIAKEFTSRTMRAVARAVWYRDDKLAQLPI